jgi:hypothetical protein
LIWRILGAHPFVYRAYTAAQLHPVYTVGATYVIEPSHAPGMVLTACDGGMTNGTRVILHAAASASDSIDAAAERWRLETADSPLYFRLVNAKSGRCLEIDASSTAGAMAQLWDWRHGQNQEWRFAPAGNFSYALANRGSSELLDLKVRGTANGTPVQQRSSMTAEPVQWRFSEVRKGKQP